MYVETAEDAERIRAQYSGQPIDGCKSNHLS